MNFKDKVLKVVKKIKPGRVLSYQEVSRLAGNPRAQRAVGNFMKQNHNPKIPCHRVIKSDFSLGGYSGGTQRKIRLLKKEGLKIEQRGRKFFVVGEN